MFDSSGFDSKATLNAPFSRQSAHWGAVLALTLCVSTLIASEFMPVSLLTPIAQDLRLSEGMAGQAISISGLFAVLTSLSISSLTRRLDRRAVLLALTGLMFVSALLVAFAPSYAMLMTGRALLGVVVGGFWSMSAATVMRLVPGKDTARALALLNGGNALATTIAAPLGSYLGQFIGWRGAFLIVAPLAVATFVWQWLTLPKLPPDAKATQESALGVLRLPKAGLGMLAVGLLFAGQFALFTYLRPFLESVTGLDVTSLSVILLAMGVAGLLGNVLVALLVDRRLVETLAFAPIVMAAIAAGLILWGAAPAATAILLAVWGLVGTALPVAWWTWLSRTFPNEAEAAGGLMVAVIQLAITLGAAGGGWLYDLAGHRATFLFSALCLTLCGAVFTFGVRTRTLRGTPLHDPSHPVPPPSSEAHRRQRHCPVRHLRSQPHRSKGTRHVKPCQQLLHQRQRHPGKGQLPEPVQAQGRR